MTKKILSFFVALLIAAVSALAQSYSATFPNTNLQQTIDVLRKATGHDFVYKKSLIKDENLSVNGTYSSLSLTDLLDKTVVDQLGLAYKIEGNTVALTKADVKTVTKPTIIKGRVVDEDGEPLVSVAVFVKGKQGAGTLTDIDGSLAQC